MARAERHGTVLLVDDDRTFLRTFAREFERRDWRVSTAEHADEVAPAARRLRPAVIVLDLMLGDASGLDLIEELRGQTPAARIVVTTGHPSFETAVEAMRRGAHHYVSKPCNVDTLIDAAAAEPEPSAPPTEASLAQSERAHIDRMVEACNGNISEAARRLGLHRRSLQRKLRKHVPGGTRGES
jgi:two-component system response regulator RegA